MNIPLVEVLDVLREELKSAQAKSDPQNPLIIEEIEIELQAVVTKGADTNGEFAGKISIGVLDFLKIGDVEGKLTGSGKWEKATTQKIKLKLSAASLNESTGRLEKAKVSNKVKDEPKF